MTAADDRRLAERALAAILDKLAEGDLDPNVVEITSWSIRSLVPEDLRARLEPLRTVADHGCLALDNQMEFVATYGAPGVGQKWRCVACGRPWAKVDGMLFPEEDMAHLLLPEDTE